MIVAFYMKLGVGIAGGVRSIVSPTPVHCISHTRALHLPHPCNCTVVYLVVGQPPVPIFHDYLLVVGPAKHKIMLS